MKLPALRTKLIPAAIAMLVVAGCTTRATNRSPTAAASIAPPSSMDSGAVAQLQTTAGAPAGSAELVQTAAGVELTVRVQGLQPGLHGVHIHANGACAAGPDAATGEVVAFGAAGGHFDPGMSHNHGRPGQAAHEAHAGELPNITVAPDGTGMLHFVNTNVTLSPGRASVLGRTVVVHGNADDYETDPAGNSGPRVLCGLIKSRQGGPVVGRAVFEGSYVYPEGVAIDGRSGNAYVGSPPLLPFDLLAVAVR